MSSLHREFAHATLAEIFEQPEALRRTFERYVSGGQLSAVMWQPMLLAIRDRSRLIVAASGSSRHAGLAAELMIEELSGVDVDVEYASESIYRRRDPLQRAATMVISQSGETADTLAALREARSAERVSLAITNVAGSSMAREADVAFETQAGRERAIAATKSFVTQLEVLYLVALALAQERGRLSAEQTEARLRALQSLPATMERMLPVWEPEMKRIAAAFREAESFLFIGRELHYAIAREAALKLKEMSYLYAEAYPSGELKHGPNALLGPGAPLVVIATRDEADALSMVRYEKTLQLLKDLSTQRIQVLTVATEGDAEVGELSSECVFVPRAEEFLLPFLEIVPLQLFAYFMSVQRGVDVDRPRNLVKAVVVE